MGDGERPADPGLQGSKKQRKEMNAQIVTAGKATFAFGEETLDIQLEGWEFGADREPESQEELQLAGERAALEYIAMQIFELLAFRAGFDTSINASQTVESVIRIKENNRQ